MNTAGLEWFGPPERNTLRPLCVVLLVLSEIENGIVRSESEIVLCLPPLAFREPLRDLSVQPAPPFYISREARTWPLSPRQVGPTM